MYIYRELQGPMLVLRTVLPPYWNRQTQVMTVQIKSCGELHPVPKSWVCVCVFGGVGSYKLPGPNGTEG